MGLVTVGASITLATVKLKLALSNCWDNAPMESVNGTLKVECVNGEHFRTRSQAQPAIIEYIGYYNTERRHSSLGYMTLAKFERRWRAEGKNLTEARSQ